MMVGLGSASGLVAVALDSDSELRSVLTCGLHAHAYASHGFEFLVLLLLWYCFLSAFS